MGLLPMTHRVTKHGIESSVTELFNKQQSDDGHHPSGGRRRIFSTQLFTESFCEFPRSVFARGNSRCRR